MSAAQDCAREGLTPPTTAAGWGQHDGLLSYLRSASWTAHPVDYPEIAQDVVPVVAALFEQKLHAICHQMIRDGFTHSLQPPADLPATLASVDDAIAVLRAYDLRDLGGGVWWAHDVALRVEIQLDANRDRIFGVDMDLRTDDPNAHEDDEIVWSVSLDAGTPTAVFVAAIRAARSAS